MVSAADSPVRSPAPMAPVAPLRRLALWYFFYFAFLGAFGTYFSLYLKSLGLSAWKISLLLSLQPVMRALAPAFWGWLSDHLALRAPIILATVALSTAVVAVLPFVGHDFVPLLLILGALAFFWCAPLPLVEALTLAHLAHCVERYGRVRLWGSLGFIAAVQCGGIFFDWIDIGWLPWVCLGLIVLVLAASTGLAEAPRLTGHVTGGVRLRDVLRRPPVIGLMAAAFLMSAAHGALYVFYSIHLVDHGYSTTMVGLLWSLGVMAEILVFLRLGLVLRRASIRSLLLLCLLVAAVRFVLIGLWVGHPAVAVVAQLMHGVTFGVMHAACVSGLNRWFGPAQQSRAHALYSSASFGGGGLVGALVAGALWEIGGGRLAYGAAAVIALLGVPLVARLVPRQSA